MNAEKEKQATHSSSDAEGVTARNLKALAGELKPKIRALSGRLYKMPE